MCFCRADVVAFLMFKNLFELVDQVRIERGVCLVRQYLPLQVKERVPGTSTSFFRNQVPKPGISVIFSSSSGAWQCQPCSWAEPQASPSSSCQGGGWPCWTLMMLSLMMLTMMNLGGVQVLIENHRRMLFIILETLNTHSSTTTEDSGIKSSPTPMCAIL